MFGLGLSEIIFIAILALIFIGPKQLPEVARTVGRFLNDLKRSTSDLTDELKAQAKIDRIDLYGPMKKPTPPKAAAQEPMVTTPEFPPRAHEPVATAPLFPLNVHESDISTSEVSKSHESGSSTEKKDV